MELTNNIQPSRVEYCGTVYEQAVQLDGVWYYQLSDQALRRFRLQHAVVFPGSDISW